MLDDKYERLFGHPRQNKKLENQVQDKDLESNAKVGEIDKSNKASLKKKGYIKSGDEETRSLIKNGIPDDSMISLNNQKSKCDLIHFSN